MSSSPQDQLDRTLEEYRRKREDLRGLHERMARISATVTAPRKVVSITVGQQGDVTALTFPSGAYKSMVPAELAAVVLETVRQAQAKVREELATMMEPMMPPGFAVRDLLAGKADLDRLLPDEPGLDGVFLRRDGQ